MNKTIIVKIIIAFVLLLCCFLFAFISIKNIEQSVNHIFLSELFVYVDGNEFEVLLDKNTKETYLRINEDKEVCFKYPREGKSRLPTPKFEEIVGEDTLKNKQMILNFTYNLSYDEGCKYLKMLLDDNYVFKMYAINSQYMECFLEKGENIKRVILLSDTFMICDLMSNAELPNFLGYFTTYDYNDSIGSRINEFLNN